MLGNVYDASLGDQVVHTASVFTEDETDVDDCVDGADAGNRTDYAVHQQSQYKGTHEASSLPCFKVDNLHLHGNLADCLTARGKQIDLGAKQRNCPQ